MAGLNITTSSTGVTLSATANNPVTIASGVTLAATSGSALLSALSIYWTVGNNGTLSATGAGSDGILLATAAITNAPTGRIVGAAAGVLLSGAGNVVNQGGITATQSGTGSGYSYSGSTGFEPLSAGVLIGSGNVSNAAAGTIGSYYEGVAFVGAGTLSNAGSITASGANHGFGAVLAQGGVVANATSASVTGGGDGVLALGGAVTVNNQGLIGGGGNLGVVLGVGGLVSNAATGTIIGGATGLKAFNGPASVTNQGEIDGTSRYGVAFASGGSVNNLGGGTISGGRSGIEGYNTVPLAITNASGASITGGAYGAFAYGAATVVNAGVINGASAVGLVLLAPSSVSNASSGGIYGRYDAVYTGGSAASTIVNQGLMVGTLFSGAWMNAGGTVTNALNGGIYGEAFGVRILNASGLVTNAGTIASYQTYAAAGVQVGYGGVVTNSAGGLISSEYIGVQVGHFGTTNSSHVLVNQAVSGSVFNAGTIYANNGTKFAAAVWSHGPAYISNASSGTISGVPVGILGYYQTTVVNRGAISGSDYAILVRPNATVVPVGSITNAASASIIGGIGVYLSAGGTVTDAGTIAGTGGTALYFGGTGSNRLVLDPGASITGAVKGSVTLELAPGSGTLDGPGGFITSLQSMTVDSAASWDLSGAALLDAGGLTNNGQMTIAAGVLAATNLTGTGSVTIDNGSTLIVAGSVAATQTIVFAGSSAELILGDTAAELGKIVGSGTIVNEATALTNQASLAATASFGVVLNAGGAFTNAVSGTIVGSQDGVFVFDVAGSVVNDGSIVGTGGALGSPGIGVALAAGPGPHMAHGERAPAGLAPLGGGKQGRLDQAVDERIGIAGPVGGNAALASAAAPGRWSTPAASPASIPPVRRVSPWRPAAW